MLAIRRALAAVVVLSLALAAQPSRAQAPVTVKFPGGDATPIGPGQFACQEGGLIRWFVVLDNTMGAFDVTWDYLDVMDPAGVDSCDGRAPCIGAEFLGLLCDPPDAPDPDGGTVFSCDPARGRLDIRGIPVAAGGVSCVQFTTRVLTGARSFGEVDNKGCVTITSPAPATGSTRPTTSAAPTCVPPAPGANAEGCSRVSVPNIEPPSFSNIKTATIADVNGNGVNDVGDRITWTVTVSNTGTDPHDGWLNDPVGAGQAFVDIVDNPDGLCTFDGTSIDCPQIPFPGGATKVLTFRTDLTCAAATDDDSFRACNRANICGDAARLGCFPSDDDGVAPFQATCLPFPFTDFTASTKTWTFDDLDTDGSLSVGDRVRFSINLANDGTLTATGMTVDDVLDAACFDLATLNPVNGTFDAATGTLSWTPDDMLPGERQPLAFDVRVASTAAACCNQATISSSERDACAMPPIATDDPTTAAGDDPTCLRFGPQPVLRLTKDFALTDDVNGDGIVDTGDEVTFTVRLLNRGRGVATGVVIDDPLIPCWSGFTAAGVSVDGAATNASIDENRPVTAGTLRLTDVGGPDGLAPDGTEVVTVTFAVRSTADVATGCCNEAHATYAESPQVVDSDDPSTSFPGDVTCTTRLQQPAFLEMTKTAADQDGDGCVEAGENVTFTISVTPRDNDAHLIQVVDQIADPAGAFDVADPGTGTYDAAADTISWNVGDLFLGDSRSFQWIGRFACGARDGAVSSDVATGSAINAPSNSASASVTLATPVLVLTKSMSFDDLDGSTTLSPGDVAIFTVTVENRGTCVAEQVVVLDQLDRDLDVTAVAADGPPGNDGAGGLTWDEGTSPELATLVPGASATWTVRVPALDPRTNPDPTSDGIVANVATASARSDFACPVSARSGDVVAIIDVPNASLDLTVSVADQDGSGCFEPGETLTYTATVTPRGGAASNVQLVIALDSPSGGLVILDPGGGTVNAPPGITWDLGTLPRDVPVVLVWTVQLKCDVSDGMPFSVRGDATSSDVPPAAVTLGSVVSTVKLLVDKTFTWTDDGDGAVEPGEALKYTITIRSASACEVRRAEVTDFIDPDLDRASLAISALASDDGAGTYTMSSVDNPDLLEGILPGESLQITIDGMALDPASNPDPLADGSVTNDAIVSVPSDFGCGDATFTGTAEAFVINTTFGSVRLLRNDHVTCRAGAFATLRAFLRERPAPQECSEPPAIDPAHLGTQVVQDAVSPMVFVGDADPAASLPQCPQAAVGFGRVVVFYELDEPTPACITTLRVRRLGGDVEVSW